MKFKPTLTSFQKESLYGIFLASFKDYNRETQKGKLMSELELFKATEVSRLLVQAVDFVISPEVKE